MKKYIREFYERLYLGGSGGARAVGGKSLAIELGYPSRLIDMLPDEMWEDFLPCGNVFSRIDPKGGDKLLNLGCGAGFDSILLKLSARAEFTVVNLDSAFPVLAKANKAALPIFSGEGFDLVCADGAGLPFAPGSFDWIILNGVFNLFPDKGELIEEMNRVLKPGGIVAGADLSRRTLLPGYFADEPDAWAWCMSGAVSEEELIEAFKAGGFSKLDTAAENMDEFFDRTVFTFRKDGSEAGRKPQNPPT
ncbi:MAG: methyltransferase domain-containing protein [Syntrophobacteraceae bacterium]|nr:methyltransferase domain-containing protein [Syntrophobacteraceae bacterium]